MIGVTYFKSINRIASSIIIPNNYIKQKMLCALCLSQVKDYIFVPCSHHICVKCAPRPESILISTVKYQCETCLATHNLNLSIQPARKQQVYSFEGKDELYCWNCSMPIEISSFVRGQHHGHRVSTLADASPALKGKFEAQLQKAVMVAEALTTKKETIQNHNLQESYDRILQDIDRYFDRQQAFLAEKKRMVISELDEEYHRCVDVISEQLFLIEPALQHTLNLVSSIKLFLGESMSLDQLQDSKEIQQKLGGYMQMLNGSNSKLRMPMLPQFVVRGDISASIEIGCSILPGTSKPKEKENATYTWQRVKLVQKLKNRFGNGRYPFNLSQH